MEYNKKYCNATLFLSNDLGKFVVVRCKVGGLMGGFGSGPYTKGGEIAKHTVEDTLPLDINDIKKDLYDGTSFRLRWSWSVGMPPYSRREKSEITFYVEKDKVTLSYSTSVKKYDDPIEITWTNCNYGGKRPWFLCPGCFKRVGKLFLKNEYFRCRKCHDLTYRRCQISGNELSVIHRKMYEIGRKLQIENFKVYVNPLFLVKPKGMHQVTFFKLELQLMDLFEKKFKWLKQKG